MYQDVTFEFGYDGDYVESDQSLNFEIDAMNGVNDFKYNRGIHAVYLEYENKISDNQNDERRGRCLIKKIDPRT